MHLSSRLVGVDKGQRYSVTRSLDASPHTTPGAAEQALDTAADMIGDLKTRPSPTVFSESRQLSGAIVSTLHDCGGLRRLFDGVTSLSSTHPMDDDDNVSFPTLPFLGRG